MPRRTDSLLPGKYKQIPFKVRRESIDQLGQKRVIHDYFNSGGRYAEPQGKVPLEFTVEIFFSGEQWQDDFKQFKSALEDAAAGTLQLPTFGVFTNMVALPARGDASQTNVGEISLTVTFTQTIERPAPTDAFATDEDVSAQAEDTRQLAKEGFEEGYEAPNTLNNIQNAIQDFQSLAADVSRITGKVRDAQNFIRRVSSNIQNAVALGELLLGESSPLGLLQSVVTSTIGVNGFSDIATLGKTQPNSMNDVAAGIRPMSSVRQSEPNPPLPNTTIPVWPDDTVARRQRNNNRLISVNIFRAVGLIGMYESATRASYTTTDEIDRVKNVLDSYYQALVENDETNSLWPFIKFQLDRLKGVSEDVLAAARQNAYSVVEIDIEKYTPVTLLAYDLYGERMQSESQLNFIAGLLKGLNRQQPAHRLIGTVRVLEIR